MWYHLNLRLRIYFLLAGLVLIMFSGGILTVWHTFRMEKLFTRIIEKDVAALRMAEQMEVALVNQKGFVSYYFLDRDPAWLSQLGEYRQIFKEKLEKAQSFADTPDQKDALEKIRSEYQIYVETKDRVIAYYQEGEMNEGEKLHQITRKHFFQILSLCGEYKDIYLSRMRRAEEQSRSQAKDIRLAASTGIFTALCLSVLLAFVLIQHILNPVRSLTQETVNPEKKFSAGGNEIVALSQSVRGLIRDAGQTQVELQKSRKHLMQSEKMALMGKLAAGTAHSIRNPLTSVKMRLFSLRRSLELTEFQREDFDVISEEIRHIDTIVQNFLEFSRPPKLNMQRVSPSAVVDNAIQLLEHRLKSYDVAVKVERTGMLPEISGDPDQLKEVLVNLMVNACEAIEKSGNILIREKVAHDRSAVLEIIDDGPGIEESMREKIFQPFFTSKDEGTGLGLSIAIRIVEEHRGSMDVRSEPGRGTTFIISLPLKESEESYEHHSDH